MSLDPLIEQADEIKDCAKALTRSLDGLGLAQPSMSQGGLGAYPEDSGSQGARVRLIDALDSLKALARGPSAICNALNMLYRFDILTKIALDGSKTTEELAATSDLAVSAMRRILRHADLMRLLHETEPGSGHFEHTAFSAHISKTPRGTDWLGHNVELGGLAALRQAEAVEKFESHGRQSGNRNESGVGLHFFPDKGQDYSVFNFMIDDGEEARKGWRMRRFEAAMAYLAHQNPDGQGNSILSGFDWDKYSCLTVGGSKGHLSLRIVEKHPQINFIVNDLPFIETSFNATKAAAGAAGDQLSFLAHDFFHPWPSINFDIALMRFILHDWSDALASKLLRSLIPALKPSARILVVEHTMPEAGDQSVSRFMEQYSSAIDFQMWTDAAGKERTWTDWKGLLLLSTQDFILKIAEIVLGMS